MSEERYMREFPGYDSVLPTLQGWVDASHRDDTCPSLRKIISDEFGTIELRLWCEWMMKEDRDGPNDPRFSLWIQFVDPDDNYEPLRGTGGLHLRLTGETLEGLRREALDWFLGNVGDSIMEEDLTTAQILEQVGTMWGFHNMKPLPDEEEQLRQRLAQFIVPTGGGCEAYSIPVGFCCVFITDAGGCGLPSPGGDIPMLVGLRNANGEEVAVIETDSTLADVVKFVEALGGRADA